LDLELGPSLPLPDRAAVLEHAARLILDAWRSFDHARPGQPVPTERQHELLRRPLPQQPSDPREALDAAADVLDVSLAQSRPRFFAYIGSSGLEIGVLGDALMASHDVNVAVSAGAADELESQTIRWVGQFVGFSETARGLLAAGGTISNLTALTAARERAAPGTRQTGLTGRRMALYCSAEAHYSVRRAAEVLGIGGENVRRIPTGADRRMDPDATATAIAADRARGTVPVAVVATGGTTLTGTVDDLDALADVCAEQDVWLHVDGAYGLPAAATQTAGHWFTGLERADSATIDAHKWLGVQKSCSLVLLRRRGPLRAAFGHEERYMLHEEDTANPVDRTLEYSRPFRSLRLWLSLRVHGAAQFRDWIERTLSNAALLAEAVREHPSFELLHEPMLSTVCFRHVPAGLPEDQLDVHNERLARVMQRDGRVFLAPAIVDRSTCLRACFVNYRTTPEAVKLVLEVAAELGDSLGRGDGPAVR
jgi:aromatic-L-amino-acid decarboxylase